MAKLTKINLNSHPRGDTGILRWSWKKRTSGGQLETLSLVGYKVALTVKDKDWDKSIDDRTPDDEDSMAVKGYNDTIWAIDIDCDNPTQMHGINPAEGQVLFHLPKQANWITPGKYVLDIVVENKESGATTTVVFAELEIQGHPTNRLTTDKPDQYVP